MSTKEQIVYLNTAEIKPNPNQPRKVFDQAELEKLAQSIDMNGLIQPIVVREVTTEEGLIYELVAGERRLRAVRDVLCLAKIKCVLTKEVKTDIDSKQVALVENIQRAELNPMEQAKALQELMDLENLTQEQVAKRVGKSRPDVANLLRLFNLPNDVQELVADNQLARTKAWKLSMISDHDTIRRLAKATIANNWTLEKVTTEVDKRVRKPGRGLDGEGKSEKKVKSTKTLNLTKMLLIDCSVNEELLTDLTTYFIDQGIKFHTGQAIKDVISGKIPSMEHSTELEPEMEPTLTTETDMIEL